MIPDATIAGTTVQNFNARFVARAIKSLLKDAQNRRDKILKQTDTTLAVASVDSLHDLCLTPAREILRHARRTQADLTKVARILAQDDPPDPTHTAAIVRSASDARVTADQIVYVAPSWDSSALSDLADEYFTLANSWKEVVTAAEKRVQTLAEITGWCVAETAAQPNSALSDLLKHKLPFDLSRSGLDDDEVRRAIRTECAAKKKERPQKTVVELKQRIAGVWV